MIAAAAADTSAKPVLSKRQRTERARQIKAEKRAAAVREKLEGKPVLVARAGEKVRPAKQSMAFRYMIGGQIDGAQYSAAVEYMDLHLRCRDTKVSSYGDTRGGGDGSGLSEAQMTALRKLREADRALAALELPAYALVRAVCVDDWSASDFMREYRLDPNKGLPLLRLGLDELARLWRMPAKRAASGVESF